MRRWFLLWLYLALALPTTGKESIPAFTSVGKGLEYREVRLDSPRPLTIHQLRCDPTKVRFSLLLASDLKKAHVKAATAQEMSRKFALSAAVNSSYFGEEFELLGYAERQGQVLNPEVAGGFFSAFFYWDGRRAGFKKRGESLPKDVPVLFQAGPRLVWDGEPIEGLDPSLANRTLLSVDAEGRITVVVVGGLSRVALSELPGLLLRPVAKGGVASLRALNLDGGSSTQMSLKGSKKTVEVPGFARVPVFLGIRSPR